MIRTFKTKPRYSSEDLQNSLVMKIISMCPHAGELYQRGKKGWRRERCRHIKQFQVILKCQCFFPTFHHKWKPGTGFSNQLTAICSFIPSCNFSSLYICSLPGIKWYVVAKDNTSLIINIKKWTSLKVEKLILIWLQKNNLHVKQQRENTLKLIQLVNYIAVI